jgi:predicted CoA-substrate-specific enzyme activase
MTTPMPQLKQINTYRMGIDIGSITAKTVLLDQAGKTCFWDYRRHRAGIRAALRGLLERAYQALGDVHILPVITGSAGMGISERYRLPFIQEVIASTEVVHKEYPQVTTLLDIGGEDAKLIYFKEGGAPDIRMNGSCAGGTGAYIDEMAALLNVSLDDLNNLARQHTRIYPMASRCGVFGKTDVQNLLSRAVPLPDIAASILHAVVLQVLATLGRGLELKPKFLFCGGPLTLLPALREAFCNELGLEKGDLLEAPHMELLPARGAAVSDQEALSAQTLSKMILALEDDTVSKKGSPRLTRLFESKEAWESWEAARRSHRIERVSGSDLEGARCYLGIDSGSTTSKIVLIDEKGRVAFTHYSSNQGSALKAVQNGLAELHAFIDTFKIQPAIVRSTATGYGEDLIRTAFGLDDGIVETLAHYRAARSFDPSVSFILDIGGQDMKAIFVQDGTIENIEINEACSSGCGTFIETLAGSMGYGVKDFAQKACFSQEPCDLGSRCTVFMNSRIKQALKEAAEIEDISAGLAYSVVKNSLYKVLKISDSSQLGEHILVQGGTFRNPAVHRAFENLTQREVVCPDIAELMGAYGAALAARDAALKRKFSRSFCGLGKGFDWSTLESAAQYQKREINCRGCQNRCTVSKLIFANGGVFYTGNRCERIFSNRGDQYSPGVSVTARKLELLFDRPKDPPGEALMTIGIPRVLSFFETFPFWCTLLVQCGFKVELSDPSNQDLFKKGAGTVMSENICFPAKLTHGHIENLIEKKVDRIFFPMVFSEKTKFVDAFNSFNCPIVAGYPDVIRNSLRSLEKSGIPIDNPPVTFRDEKLLRKACQEITEKLGVSTSTFKRAFSLALQNQQEYKEAVRSAGAEILAKARQESRLVVLLMGHTYHIDPMINHGIPQILVDFGVDVITEDSVPLEDEPALENKNVPTQWELINRMYYAARWAGTQPGVEVVQLNSFACGPDAYAVDEVKSILKSFGKSHTTVRIDEVESTGSIRLRLRSLIETLRADERTQPKAKPRVNLKIFQEEDRQKTILTPHFSPFIAPAIAAPFVQMGYNIETLPPPDHESVEIGLRYAPNEICYPGIIIIGDLIKALQSGRYKLDQVVAGSWQTGGQCRATSILSLARRALIKAGFKDVPIVAISTSPKLHEQPGFRLNWLEYIPKAFLAVIYADAISSLYHATAIRERVAGQAKVLAEKLLAPLGEGAVRLEREVILDKLRSAVAQFNAIATNSNVYERAGIVGEIYVKHNPFSNQRAAQWLMDQGIEVVLPPFLEFFLGWFVSNHERVKANLQRWSPVLILADFVEKKLQSVLDQADSILQDFKHYLPRHTIRDIAHEAQKIVSLTHAYGEGWLIAGEVGILVEQGTPNILCLQPFGCIANQVVARGAFRKLKEVHPKLNMLFMDMDAGLSEVNYLNRMHFFANQAKRKG